MGKVVPHSRSPYDGVHIVIDAAREFFERNFESFCGANDATVEVLKQGLLEVIESKCDSARFAYTAAKSQRWRERAHRAETRLAELESAAREENARPPPRSHRPSAAASARNHQVQVN
jgi:hypothetical protein